MVSLDDVTLQVKQMTTQWVQSGGMMLHLYSCIYL